MSKKKKCIIGILVFLLVAALVFLVVFLLNGKKITIKFDTDGAKKIQSIEIKKGEETKLPEVSKEGFVFDGWFDGEKRISSPAKFDKDVTLKAKWISEDAKTIVIHFDSDGGSKVEDLTVEVGSKLKLPTNPTKKDFDFVSWIDESGKTVEDETVIDSEKDITLKATWKKVEETKKTFTVSFDSKGGSSVKKLTVECGKTLKLPKNPTRSGYTFTTWEDKNGTPIYNDAKLSCENITLYAVWSKVETETPKNPEPTPTVTYTCPKNYTLSGTNCTRRLMAQTRCPEGTKADGDLCIKTSDSNDGTRVCKETTVQIDGKGHTYTGKGDYFYDIYGQCAYYKWTSYTTKDQCEQAYDIHHKTKWVSKLNGCYAETNTNYTLECASDYQYYTTAELASKFGIAGSPSKCLKKVAKEKYCIVGTLSGSRCRVTIPATVVE